jgi:hypothetical protein
MTPADTLKMSLGLIFGIAADAAVSAALGGLMPAGRGWKHLLRIGGTFVLAMMVGEKAEEYVCKVFDDTRNAMTEAKKEMAEQKAPETGEE